MKRLRLNEPTNRKLFFSQASDTVGALHIRKETIALVYFIILYILEAVLIQDEDVNLD